MKTLLVILSLLVLSGCAGMEFVAVDYHSGHNYGPYVRPVGHISYTLGYYSDSHYNGYSVYGSYGHRYYYAPTHYSHHRHYSSPPVVVHRHVHTSVCYVRGGHSYVAPRHTPPVHVRNDRHRTPPRVTPPRRTPPQVRNNHRAPPQAVPPRQREHRADRRVDKKDRRGNRKDRDRHEK